MLLFVLHLLGDLLEIGSRSCELRRLSVLQQDFQGPQRVLFLRASSALQTLCIGQVTYAIKHSRDTKATAEDMVLNTWAGARGIRIRFERVGNRRRKSVSETIGARVNALGSHY